MRVHQTGTYCQDSAPTFSQSNQSPGAINGFVSRNDDNPRRKNDLRRAACNFPIIPARYSVSSQRKDAGGRLTLQDVLRARCPASTKSIIYYDGLWLEPESILTVLGTTEATATFRVAVRETNSIRGRYLVRLAKYLPPLLPSTPRLEVVGRSRGRDRERTGQSISRRIQTNRDRQLLQRSKWSEEIYYG